MRQTFRKDERLHSKILIKKLFTEGDSFYIHPFRVTSLQTDYLSVFPVQLLISVPKQSFKNAVDRNLLKRRIREAYRKNKEVLVNSIEEKHIKMIVCFTYTAKTILPYSAIQDKIIIILQRLKMGNGKTPG